MAAGITGRRPCCPAAASGHTTAAVPRPSIHSHLVGSDQEARRYSEPERFRGFQVEDGLVFGRCLHRQVGRVFALEDTIDIAGLVPVLVDVIRPPAGRDGRMALPGAEQKTGVQKQDEMTPHYAP